MPVHLVRQSQYLSAPLQRQMQALSKTAKNGRPGKGSGVRECRYISSDSAGTCRHPSWKVHLNIFLSMPQMADLMMRRGKEIASTSRPTPGRVGAPCRSVAFCNCNVLSQPQSTCLVVSEKCRCSLCLQHASY